MMNFSLAFRKPKSLKDILVRAGMSPRSAYNGQCQKCDSRRCMTCKNIQCTQTFSSTHTGEKFIIYYNANCKTENIIYLLECAMCGLQYIGETKQQLSKHLNGHRSARHTSSRITFLTLTIVGRSRGHASSHQDVFQTFGFPEGQDGWFFEDFTQFWMFLYGCPVLTNDVG
jgi:hypothetical protein